MTYQDYSRRPWVMPPPKSCETCGAAIPVDYLSRAPRWCSSACRGKAWRAARKAAGDGPMTYTLTGDPAPAMRAVRDADPVALPPPHPRWCSSRCKMAAWRTRKKLRQDAVKIPESRWSEDAVPIAVRRQALADAYEAFCRSLRSRSCSPLDVQRSRGPYS
jgi:predicted nucleic acid-binding Zn ribbon protein